ncbi:DUF6499 domain-containing protein [Mesorhizobium sp. B2-4-17]|uniref:transcriptional regulator domain-containing protein n=1 Tax=Mesorhizobium sp. B2-4-17 TaxID=2589932 RepID=UPI001FED2EC7|nr:DUF6499 domain-containing protein [Mesorhizobium sp. B2-4-17]
MPNTSHWRDDSRYEFFDNLPVEGLAWECLRRSDPYRRLFLTLADAGAESEPFPPETQQLWGLRFPGQTRLVSIDAERPLVPLGGSGRADPHAFSGFPVIRTVHDARRVRFASPESARIPCRP